VRLDRDVLGDGKCIQKSLLGGVMRANFALTIVPQPDAWY